MTTRSRRKQQRGYQFVFVLENEDRESLARLAEHERLSRADVMRRLIRAAAKKLERGREATAA